MFRNKYLSLILTALLAITTVFGSSAVLAQGQTPPQSGSDQSGGQPPFLKHGKITQADRQAAADKRAQGGGVSAAVAPTATDAYGNLVPDYFGTAPNYANSPLPTRGSGGTATGGIVKFQDPLPNIPIATPDVVTYPGSDYYVIALQQFTAQFSASLPATTQVRGYVQLNSGTNTTGCTIPTSTPKAGDCTLANNTALPAAIQYLGPIIVAKRDRPTRIKFTNMISPGAAGDLFLPVDTTYMGAGYGPDAPASVGLDDCSVPPPATRPAYCYSQNRATLHLHGGTTPWISDGTPHQWTTPAGETTAPGGSMYPKGVSVYNVPDMDAGVEPAGTLTFYYTNQESARLMFYHDHAYGLTRLNVYAGEAAGYLLTDQVEADLIAGTNVSGGNPGLVSVLPSVGTPLVLQDKTFVPGPTQLAAEDPTWNTARWGGLGNFWYPHVYMTNQNPYDMTGANPMGRWDYGQWFWPPFTGQSQGTLTNPYYDPLCNSATTYCEPPVIPGTPVISGVPEGFMDTPLVNGKAYPVMNVTAGMQRFRILNASNDRFMNLQLYVASPIIGSIDVTTPGSGYTVPPAITITNGAGDTTGHGAVGVATIDPVSGAVTSIYLKAVGSRYTAKPSVTISAPPVGGVQAVASANLYSGLTEVGMVPFNSTQNVLTPFPAGWYTTGVPFSLDDRDGGVPDPATRGPAMVQIGTEGGWLPNPVLIPNTPVNFDYNRKSITVLNVLQHGLWLGPAERADVLVDFTNFSGKTLILYNDSPAPVPAGDPRNDYYTGGPDQTSTGGAPSTLPGYGPNTRTIMQIVVAGGGSSTAPVDDFSATALTALQTALPKAFAVDQETIVFPQAPYNAAYNPGVTCPGGAGCFPSGKPAYVGITDMTATFDPIGPTAPITMSMQPKAIQELFTVDYGRMNATLGVELPNTNQTIQTTIPYGYIDPITELLQVTDKAVPIGATGDGTQIWKITHNGVDTHVIHVHMFTMQLINRVGWDGAIKPPDPQELGWKDTIRMNPLEDVIVAIRPISLVNLPFKMPDSIRMIDPTRPAGSTMGYFGVNPLGNPVTIVNQLVNFGWEYVWHCHILGHEENDMMRPMAIAVPPEAPSGLVATAQAGSPYRVNLTWTENSLMSTGFIVQRDITSAFSAPTNFTVVKAAGAAQSYTDSTATKGIFYFYQVLATNTVGGTAASGFTAAAATGYSTLTVTSAPSNVFQIPSPPAAFTKLAPATGTFVNSQTPTLSWQASAGAASYAYCIDTVNNAACDTSWINVGTNTSAVTSLLNGSSTYYWEVEAINPGGITLADAGTWWSLLTHTCFGLTTAVSPVGAGTVGVNLPFNCGGSRYLTGTVLQLTASPTAPYVFSAWSGSVTGTTNPISLTMSAARSVTATFVVPPPAAFAKLAPATGTFVNSQTPTLSWQASAGAASYAYCIDTVNNAACDTTWINVGTSTSAVTSLLNGSSTYYWEVRATNLGGTTLANAGTWWSLLTHSCFGLTTSVSPLGTGTVGVNLPFNCGGSTYLTGTVLNLTATPTAGFTFGSWTGSVTGTTNPISVTMSAARTVTANFNGAPRAFGKSAPATGTFVNSQTPTLSWQASVGAASYAYCIDTINNAACDATWINVGTSTSAVTSLLNGSSTYYWEVEAINPTGTTLADAGTWWNLLTHSCFGLTTSVSPAGAGTVAVNLPFNCGGNRYLTGTVLQLTASPIGAHTFVAWSGNLTGTTNPISLTMNAAKVVTANFTP